LFKLVAVKYLKRVYREEGGVGNWPINLEVEVAFSVNFLK
jgi:hypothetical protein